VHAEALAGQALLLVQEPLGPDEGTVGVSHGRAQPVAVGAEGQFVGPGVEAAQGPAEVAEGHTELNAGLGETDLVHVGFSSHGLLAWSAGSARAGRRGVSVRVGRGGPSPCQ
jgi:hypothetical protein